MGERAEVWIRLYTLDIVVVKNARETNIGTDPYLEHMFVCLFVYFLLSPSFYHYYLAELCALSEYRIYPGNGKLMIRRDGKPIWLGSSKAHSLTIQRKKAAKLVWTQAWRRLHKKGLTETTTKKRSRRTGKVQRAVVGASLDDIKKKAAQKTELRTKAKEAALKELKDRKATNKAKSGGKGVATKKAAPATFQKIPKHMGGMGGKGKRGGTLR